MAIQKRIYTSGIDSDTTSELLPQGRDRFRLNVRVLSSDNSTIGAIETVNGNSLVSFTLPLQTNTVIGSKEDLIRKKIYYFIHNALDEHLILEFDSVANSIQKVFQSPVLNFDINHLITGINFIKLDDNNHLLYWTDNFNEPRKINIEKGIKFMQGDFVNGYPSPFNPENIYRIKQPMLLSPNTIYDNDLSNLVNRLDKKLFQFKVQFVYDDNEISSWSPISKTVYPLSVDTVGKNNVINVTVDTGIEIVKRIRIAVQQVNNPDFGLVVDLDKKALNIASNSAYTYKFYNDGNYLPLVLQESIKLFDSVPKLSQSQELIFGNRITDGLITEGFDAVPVDLKLDYVLSSSVQTFSIASIKVTAGGAFYNTPPLVVITGDGSGATAYATILGHSVVSVIITNPGSGYTTATVSFINFSGSGAAATATLTGADSIPVVSLKRDGVYTYGNIYYDHGNRSGVTNINDGRFDNVQNNGNYGTKLFIPFYTEHAISDTATFSFTMNVDGSNVSNGGSGYTGATTVTFSGGGASVQATATPNIGTGFITNIGLNAGSGYNNGTFTAVPLIGGSGTGATADITIVGGAITIVTINAHGNGYHTGDLVAPDTGIVGTPSVAAVLPLTTDYQAIISLAILTNGVGYTSMPTISFSVGTGAIVSPTMEVEGITIVNAGSGYTSVPLVSFTNAVSATTALAHTTISGGSVNTVVLDNAGSGYLTFPTLLVTNPIAKGGYPTVSWKIYNEAPSWATHYQIARVKNSANSRYLQFIADTLFYHDKDGNQKTFGDSSIISMDITIANLTGSFKVANPGSTLVYGFTKGDRIRFIKDASGNFYTNYFDFEIGSYNVGTSDLGIKFPPGAYPGILPDFTAGCLFEIYQPQLQITENEELTFEIGCGNTISYDSVNNKYIHNGDVQNELIIDFSSATYNVATFTAIVPSGHGILVNDEVKIKTSGYSIYGDVISVTATTITITTNTIIVGTFNGALSGTISRCAKGVFSGGDTFYRVRQMQYGSTIENRLIEDANYSDLFISPGYDYGRPNRIDPTFKEVTRLSTVYYSEKFIPETFINGLSTVYDTNFETYEDKYGGIYKLYNEDQSLIMFQELKVARIPVQQIIYNELSIQNTVGASTVVLSPQAIYYAGQFGIGKNPESFFVYANAKYFIDVRRGTPVRLSLDGLTPIGDTCFMHNYFTDKCRTILNSSSKINIYGVYDIKFKEYVIAFGSGQGVTAETLAFNEKENAWSTFYSYTPEGLCSNGIDIVSFKNGALWTHNTNAIQNNFYGIQYDSQVWSVLNQEPSNVKIFEAIGEETLDVWEAEVSNTNGQLTNLISQDFQFKEGMQYAPLWFDQNTPNVSNPLIEGDVMRAQTFLVKMKYKPATYNKLFAMNFNYIISNLHR